ncbi:MAG: porin [Bacteroidota bacterium]|nr:porin [Bacteroidota bacterium]
MKLFATVSLFILYSVSAIAGGEQINEHGARATGMGGAFAAQSSDASAIYFNPAGLAFQPGIRLLGGTTLIFPSSSYTDPAPSTTKTNMVSQVFYPSNLYGTYSINDKLVIGLGIFNPFGLGTEWPSHWPGRYLAIKADIQTFFFNPSVGYKINDQLSVGIGVSYVYSSVSLSQATLTFTDSTERSISSTDGAVKLSGNGSGFNFDAGLLYKPFAKMSLGASYRHSTKIAYSGTISFSNMQGLTKYTPGGTGGTSLTFPSNIFAGIAYDVLPELTLEADYQGVGWSSYDKLAVNVSDGPPDPHTNLPRQTSIVQIKDWENVYLIRFGGEYRYNDHLAFRAGYIFDKTPQPDKTVEPLLPDADRNDFTIGIGYTMSHNVTVDAVYMLVLFNSRTETLTVNPFPGTYKSSANLFGVDVGYNF